MMKMIVLRLMLLLLGLYAGEAMAQEVKGVIKDKTGGPLPGVTVQVVGTSSGVSSDIDGNFTIKVADARKALLRFSFVGMKTKEVEVRNQTNLNVVMEDENTALDEVVVVGYGTQKRGELTGSVSSVSGKVLATIPVASTAEALTGRMAGVQVTTTEGSPDADIKIRVRGGGSISQDNSPLYIVDGFPVNSIGNIPPGDIQSIDVLKDASSTAIYGARGANGVVIVTTKSGSEGKISVNLNAYVGFRQKVKSLGVLNPYEYVQYQHELDPTTASASTFNTYYGDYRDLGIYKSIKGTDWQDEVFGRTAMSQNYNIGISGGSKSTKFNLSLTRTDEESIMIGSDFERNNINFKMNTKISDRVNVDFNTRMSYSVINGAGTSSEKSGANTKLRNAVKYAPTTGLREFSSSSIMDDDLNSPETSSLLYDPVESVNDEYKKQKKLETNFNAAVNWKVVKGLTFRTEWGYTFKNNRTDYVWGEATSTAKQYAGQPVGRIYNYDGRDWRFANTLTYETRLNNIHNLNVLIGQEMSSSGSKSVTNESRFFPAGMEAKDVLAMFNLGTAIPTETKIPANDNLSSFFGRVNYSLYDRYLLTVTFRADGSSKFSANNRWGYFPSAALAWRINEESFLKPVEWLSNLKLRLSYGTAGNNRIDSGLWRVSYSTSNENKPYFPNENEGSQLIPSATLANRNLKWETTYTSNVGVDYGFFGNRLSGTIDLYYNKTKDLLIEQPIPESTGYSTQMKNVGQTSNRGIEFVVEGTMIDHDDFTLSASFNIAFNKNKVDKFRSGDSNYKTYSSGWNGSAAPTSDYIVREGEEVGQMYGYVTDGMYTFDDFNFDAASKKWILKDGVADNSALISPVSGYFGPGALKFKNMNDDNVIDEKDKMVLGSALPKYNGGFNLTGRWKGLDFSAFLNWSYGNKIYNANKLDYTGQLMSRKYQNLSDEMVLSKRFTTVDPATGHNIYSGQYADPALLQQLNQGKTMWMPLHTTTVLHSYAVEDGSFLRLNNVTVGYTLPKMWTRKAYMEAVRIYFTGYNLATWTKYSGFDPEVDTRRDTPLTPGVDYSAYPKSRQYVVGLNVTF